ncbi:EAL domain-containing protein [Catellatospora bangladeshensis]|uniref:EAL domain-containing protein n=1 Tax=Catellatospora bangladeshensis TaxID=310355 RepID=UPI00361E53AD
MSRGSLYPVFQPIVSLDSGGTVGYEALIRGPSGSAFATPDKLFREGARAGRLAELDWICRAASCRAALMAGLPTTVPLFLNAEPATFRTRRRRSSSTPSGPPPTSSRSSSRSPSGSWAAIPAACSRRCCGCARPGCASPWTMSVPPPPAWP